MNRPRLLAILFFALVIGWPAHATVPLDGYFIAGQDCPAYSSFRKKKNPGNQTLIREQAYQVIGKNKSAATHYLLRVKDADPQERWVEVSCGMLLADCNSSGEIGGATGGGNGGGPGAGSATGKEYLLAVSWQPAFCQTHQDKHKVECETQTAERFDATHFALHGLWPQPRGKEYCDVSNVNQRLDQNKAWGQLPPLGLTDTTLADLTVTMPGVASYLQRHEWYKHGSCYGPPEEYYQDSLALMDQLNDSPLRELFAGNIGQSITANQIRAGFDRAFGAGSGGKVRIKCKSGMITELWINLKGGIDEETELSDLLAAGAPTDKGCNAGRVDAAGF
jgi:ribonuclease T2